MSKLSLSVDQMLRYHEILDNEMEIARSGGHSTKLEAIMKRRTAIQMMIDTALFNTIEEKAPELKIDMNMFDMKALALVLPGVNLKALGQQVTIEFTESEDVTPTPAHNGDLRSQLYELLKNNFVQKIPEAIQLFNASTGKNLKPADAWKEIKLLVSEIPHFKVWDGSIATKMRNEGPIMAYVAVKKHLKDWSDFDISRVVEDAIKNTIAHPKTPFTEAKELDNLLSNPFPRNQIKAWASNPCISEVVKSYIAENADNNNSRSIAEYVIAVMDPSKRDKIEKGTGGRKPYVEKGY